LAVSGGSRHTCGVRRDHTLWCWGSDFYGQLGRGDNVNQPSPTQVGTDTDWAQVALGLGHTCGIRVDHTLWCWGNNWFGQLGLGDEGKRKVPRRV